MGLRRQLPVYSPVRLRSLLAGASGALGIGDPVRALGARLTEHFGTPDQLIVDSGTSALRLAIEGAFKAHGGDTVALPAYCCYDVATAAVGAGARIRLYDIDPVTLGPDWDSLDGALTAGVAAVVVVHLYGVPVDMIRIESMATASRAIVIEDAAQGIGGSIGGRPLGSVGSLGILSFGRGKGLTGGGGGALLANDEVGRAILVTIRGRIAAGHPGWSGLLRLAAQWLFGRPSVYGLPASMSLLGLGETHYKDPWEPRGIARGHAAALLANWEASMAEAEMRKRNAAEISRWIGGSDPKPATVRPGVKRVHGAVLRLPVLLDIEALSSSVMDSLTRLGVVEGYPATLDSIPDVLASLAADATRSGANRLARDLMTVPVHSRSGPDQTRSAIAAAGRISPAGGNLRWHGNGG